MPRGGGSRSYDNSSLPRGGAALEGGSVFLDALRAALKGKPADDGKNSCDARGCLNKDAPNSSPQQLPPADDPAMQEIRKIARCAPNCPS